MAVVGDRLVSFINIERGFVTLWVEYEVDAVNATTGRVSDLTPKRWAIRDQRRTGARDQRPIMGLTPRANQYTTDPAAINWQNLNNPQQAAYKNQGLHIALTADDRVP